MANEDTPPNSNFTPFPFIATRASIGQQCRTPRNDHVHIFSKFSLDVWIGTSSYATTVPALSAF